MWNLDQIVTFAKTGLVPEGRAHVLPPLFERCMADVLSAAAAAEGMDSVLQIYPAWMTEAAGLICSSDLFGALFDLLQETHIPALGIIAFKKAGRILPSTARTLMFVSDDRLFDVVRDFMEKVKDPAERLRASFALFPGGVPRKLVEDIAGTNAVSEWAHYFLQRMYNDNDYERGRATLEDYAGMYSIAAAAEASREIYGGIVLPGTGESRLASDLAFAGAERDDSPSVANKLALDLSRFKMTGAEKGPGKDMDEMVRFADLLVGDAGGERMETMLLSTAEEEAQRRT